MTSSMEATFRAKCGAAGEPLLKAARRLSHVPTTVKTAARFAVFAEDEAMVAAAQHVVGRFARARDEEVILYFALVLVLLFEASERSRAVLRTASAVAPKDGPDLEIWRRLAGFVPAEPVSSLVARWSATADRRDRSSPAAAVAKAIGFKAPAKAWSVRFTVCATTGQRFRGLMYPRARVSIFSGDRPCEVELATSPDERTAFEGDTCVSRSHAAVAPPRDWVRVRAYLDGAAPALGVRWDWDGQLYASTSGLHGSVKARVLAWLGSTGTPAARRAPGRGRRR